MAGLSLRELFKGLLGKTVAGFLDGIGSSSISEVKESTASMEFLTFCTSIEDVRDTRGFRSGFWCEGIILVGLFSGWLFRRCSALTNVISFQKKVIPSDTEMIGG